MTSFVILGAGGIANKFADAVALLPDVSVKAVASKHIEKAERFAQKHGIAGA